MTAKPKRPRSVTVTLIGVVLLGVWNAGQVVAIARQYRILSTLEASPDPRLRLVISGVWMLLFWGAAMMLWQRRSSTRRLIPGILIIYGLYEMVWSAMFDQALASAQIWMLKFALFIAAILFAYWALNRSKTRSYYEPQN